VIRSLPRLRALVAVSALFALASCAAARPPAATVEGERITDAQLAHDVALFTFLSSLSQSSCGQPAKGESADSACARFTLSNVIQEDLAKHYAAAHDVTVQAQAVTDTISQLETGLGGATQLDAQLEAAGITRADLTELARRLLLFDAVRTSVANERVTDDQLRQLYQQNATQFTQLHVEHILVETEEEARRIAEQATAENFLDLAKKHSIDPSVKQNAGDLGSLPASQLDQTFVQAALALRPGGISGPVQTQYGWHIILLVDAPQVTPFEQVRDQLLSQASGQVFDVWLRERIAGADITVNPRYGRFDPTTGAVAPIRSTATGSATSAPPQGATAGPTP
jgi:parvulin-like peptidyl-prolyl isomerase